MADIITPLYLAQFISKQWQKVNIYSLIVDYLITKFDSLGGAFLGMFWQILIGFGLKQQLLYHSKLSERGKNVFWYKTVNE